MDAFRLEHAVELEFPLLNQMGDLVRMRRSVIAATSRKCRAPQLLSAIRNRLHYARQGIVFSGGAGPFNVERRVSQLLRRDLTRDHLFEAPEVSDFVATWRGFRVQLYATSRPAIEALVHPSVTGRLVDRDTPARHSIGQLTPSAITFTSTNAADFHTRKRNILRAADPHITDRVPLGAVQVSFTGMAPVDIRAEVTAWSRAVMGEIVWGGQAMSTSVAYEPAGADPEQAPFAIALYDTFTRLRLHSSNFWVRVHPSLASAPLTAEIRRLHRNIDAIQRHAQRAIDRAEEGTIATRLSVLNQNDGVPAEHTRDDVLTCFLAGTDTTKTAILAVLWHLLHPRNAEWRRALTSHTESVQFDLAKACVYEGLRLTTPGSVFNGVVIQDFDMQVASRRYRLRGNTLIMPSVHAAHARYGDVFAPHRLLTDKGQERPLVMPFGKGLRSCPGKNLATKLVVNFVVEFLRVNTEARLANPFSDPNFNTTSTAPLMIEYGDPTTQRIPAVDKGADRIGD